MVIIMKKTLTSILLAGITLTLVACGSPADSAENTGNAGAVTVIHAEYPYYDSANDLVNSADFIFSGTVEGISCEILDVRTEPDTDSAAGPSSSSGIPYTIYEIKVDTVYKGTAEEDTVSIKVPGGEMDGNQYIIENAPAISLGETCLFLTETYEHTYPSLLNVTQATYDLNAPEAYEENAGEITLSQILEILE